VSLGYSGSFTASKPREFWCGTCGARCTRSINGGLEYGHLVGCPHRPDPFSKGTSDGARRYKPDDVDGGASA
jgi:hypothetical protein